MTDSSSADGITPKSPSHAAGQAPQQLTVPPFRVKVWGHQRLDQKSDPPVVVLNLQTGDPNPALSPLEPLYWDQHDLIRMAREISPEVCSDC